MSFPGGGYSPYPPHSQGSGQYPQPQPYPGATPSPYPVPGSAAPPGSMPGYPSANPPYPNFPSSQPAPYPTGGAPGFAPTQPPYPPQPSAYPTQPSPYPSSQPSPYPSSQPSPYPPAQQSPYAPAQQSPYPPAQQSPYPPTQQSSYPPAQQSPYPSSQPSPYQPAQQSPYPTQVQSSTYHQLGSQASPGSHAPPPSSGHHSSPYPQQAYGTAAPSTHAQSQGHYSKGTPSVRPANPFDPRADAEVLRRAMKGFGTDEKAIIQVLTNRTNAQRQEIAHQFKALYGKDLISNLKSEISGNFEDLVLALMTPVDEFRAKEIHHATSGIGTNESTLVELLCAATNQEIHAMKAAYQRLFYSNLEKDLGSDTSGSFRRLMVSLCQGRRDENYIVDHRSAVMDAQALLNAGELKLGTDESTFNSILVTRSYPQLIQIFMEYQRLAGHGIEKAIKGEFSGDIEEGLMAIIKSVKDKSGFFAELLYDSMKGAGTKDRALIRIVTLRSEIDMEDIKRAFMHKYGKSLADVIKDDTSGDYKKCLLAIVE